MKRLKGGRLSSRKFPPFQQLDQFLELSSTTFVGIVEIYVMRFRTSLEPAATAVWDPINRPEFFKSAKQPRDNIQRLLPSSESKHYSLLISSNISLHISFLKVITYAADQCRGRNKSPSPFSFVPTQHNKHVEIAIPAHGSTTRMAPDQNDPANIESCGKASPYSEKMFSSCN